MLCKYCLKEVSHGNTHCPYCFKRIKGPSPKVLVLCTIGGLFVLSTIVSAISGGSSNTDTKSTINSSTDTSVSKTVSYEPGTEIMDVDYKILFNCPEDYKGKYVRISGPISDIKENNIHIEQGLPGLIGCISIENNNFPALNKGDFITVTGKVGHKVLGMLSIRDARLESYGDEAKRAFKNKEEEFVNSCKTFDYKELCRNPSKYDGAHAKFKAKVAQVCETDSKLMLRAYVTPGKYWWEDDIWIECPRENLEPRILEDDIIEVYGRLKGTKEYTTVIHMHNTVPELQAVKIIDTTK